MSKKSLLLVAVMVMLALAAFGCGQGEQDEGSASGETPTDGEILVGIMVPTTGSEATYGKDMENSFNLAVDHVNAAGGIGGKKIKTVTADDACDPIN
jgi:branched-chain amino acid transport system substrate-binding protein